MRKMIEGYFVQRFYTESGEVTPDFAVSIDKVRFYDLIGELAIEEKDGGLFTPIATFGQRGDVYVPSGNDSGTIVGVSNDPGGNGGSIQIFGPVNENVLAILRKCPTGLEEVIAREALAAA
jgi:hypothetical protein